MKIQRIDVFKFNLNHQENIQKYSEIFKNNQQQKKKRTQSELSKFLGCHFTHTHTV